MGEILYYYQIIPASPRFRGNEALTYSSPEELNRGQIVEIDFRGIKTLGVIVSKTTKPNITVKQISTAKENFILPNTSINLLAYMNQYYPGYAGTTAQLFAPSFAMSKNPVVTKEDEEIHDILDLPELTKEQKSVYTKINELESPSTLLLHGETGSGKTRIYIELTKKALAQNRSALILTPEISLTTPLARQFREVFGNSVLINHSSLTPKQRLNIWTKILFGKKPIILIGPRSSLFMPLSDLGLIVVDEFHESAYKQESAPFYSALRVASMLSRESGAKLILGSATPTINEYFLAKTKNVPIIRMVNQAITGKPRVFETKVIDLSGTNERSPYPLLSNSLIKMLGIEMESGRQSILFINKRGSARTILCQDCGWRSLCPNCDLPLVYHKDSNTIRCHTCGFSDSMIFNCPDCGSANIQFKNPGTKTIVDHLSKLFPRANILRFDKDNKKQERLENKYDAVRGGEADIIVGTQLIIKGHDLPKLGLIAMLQAESSLNFPDFSSEEKSFQMIRQLSGRVGRGHGHGKVVLQTFEPNSPTIDTAINGGWDSFYSEQILQREKLGFPPFYHALKIEASRKTRKSAQESIEKLSSKIESSHKGIIVLGPSPSFIEKKAGNYCWQIIVKAKDRKQLCEIILDIKGNYKTNIDPSDFL